MFSKSVGCTGGSVLVNGPFARESQTQGKKLTNSKIKKLSTIILLRILGLLGKPMLIQHRMGLVQEKAVYVARALDAAGCSILSSPGSAIICFPVGKPKTPILVESAVANQVHLGTMRQVALFHAEAQKMGIAIVGGGPPATPVWYVTLNTTPSLLTHLLGAAVSGSASLRLQAGQTSTSS